MPPRVSKLDPFKPAIDEILKADLDAPRKQRHTITRIYRRLTDEHQMRNVIKPISCGTQVTVTDESAGLWRYSLSELDRVRVACGKMIMLSRTLSALPAVRIPAWWSDTEGSFQPPQGSLLRAPSSGGMLAPVAIGKPCRGFDLQHYG